MTTIGHKKFESVQLYRDSVLMYEYCTVQYVKVYISEAV